MSRLHFSQTELAAAAARGVSQCVVIGSRASFSELFENLCHSGLQIFALGEEQPANSQAAFVPTQFAFETLASALARSEFDHAKASLFVWLGGAGYRTFESVIASFTYIASLPKGSGVLFDYVERASLASRTCTALDALASRITVAGENLKYLIQPQAVTALLRGLGFLQIIDVPLEEPLLSRHLVSAVL